MAQATLPVIDPGSPTAGGHETCLGCTKRQDSWLAGPAATFLAIMAFIVYSTWAAFQGQHYYAEPYLSPFYAPVLLERADPALAGTTITGSASGQTHAWFGTEWPAFIPGFVTPAMLILIFPGAFRFTCYYYRKAYYRSFAASPPGCAVGGVQYDYKGERALLVFQNLHRYALYIAIIFIGLLYWDAFLALKKNGQWGIGVGTLVLFANATLLAGFTFGCNSFRHLVGGNLDWYSTHPIRHRLWRWVTVLNQRHMQFAWVSLFSVGFADFYVRMVSMGKITDLNTWQ